MSIVKMFNLGLRFLLELCLLAAFGYWGFRGFHSIYVKMIIGIGTPLLAAILWGFFVAPKASIRLAEPIRFIIELLLFAAAFAALFTTGRQSLAYLFIIIYAVNRLFLFIWRQ
ncbi:YrdB family protein [Paenibacillus aestuarii]|uniref:YrdB family protein n=1 Tax=Paenibacillus aestuarii TaxID=516965 RepID=A0ABW0KBZ9_9BACL|nr:YrdB family protein [Paenibacillus aestuarii]